MKTGSLLALIFLALSFAFAASACSTAAPVPTQAPAVLTKAAETAKSASAAAPAATKSAEATKPAATAVAESAASSDWKAEWDKTVAAAIKEGKVVVAGAQGEGWRLAADEFHKAYPNIALEYNGSLGRDSIAKILAERRGDQFLWDVYMGGTSTIFSELIPNNALDPLRPALILPEVLDDSKWHSGFAAGFVDKAGLYAYEPTGHLSAVAQVNRDLAPATVLGTMDDLLEPRWKGKIAWQDPRLSGAGQAFAAHLLAVEGEDWLRKLLSQDIIPMADTRALLEGLARGRYAVAIGTRPDEREQLKQAGLLGNVEELARDTAAGSDMTGGSGHVALFNKAAHPNAAKVYINWYMSKEGQEAHMRYAGVGSRRLDAEGQPYNRLVPGVKYLMEDSEQYLWMRGKVSEIAKELIK